MPMQAQQRLHLLQHLPDGAAADRRHPRLAGGGLHLQVGVQHRGLVQPAVVRAAGAG